MIGPGMWINNMKDADFIYGGEIWTITEDDIERLKKGEILNLFVNDEYGCVLKYGGNENE